VDGEEQLERVLSFLDSEATEEEKEKKQDFSRTV
jgi:hypothetical protein